MTCFFKGKAISQVDTILIDSVEYKRADLVALIKKCGEKK